MALDQIYDNGGSAIQIIPVNINAGKLDDVFGTVIDLNVIGDVGFTFPMTGSESSDERNEIQLVNGITVSTPKRTKKVDKSGNEVIGSGGDSGDAYQIVVNCYESDIPFINSIIAVKSTPLVVWAPVGESNADGFGWLLCVLDGNVEIKRQGNSAQAVQLTFKGKAYELDTGVTAGSFLTALTAKISPISQPGLDASYDLDPTENVTSSNGMLVAGDIANPGLLAGTIVLKQGA